MLTVTLRTAWKNFETHKNKSSQWIGFSFGLSPGQQPILYWSKTRRLRGFNIAGETHTGIFILSVHVCELLGQTVEISSGYCWSNSRPVTFLTRRRIAGCSIAEYETEWSGMESWGQLQSNKMTPMTFRKCLDAAGNISPLKWYGIRELQQCNG